MKRDQGSTRSNFTDGRARETAILMAWLGTPAIASAITIDKKMRAHFLLPRRQAIQARMSPSAMCSGQSPKRLTLYMKLYITRFRWWTRKSLIAVSKYNAGAMAPVQ